MARDTTEYRTQDPDDPGDDPAQEIINRIQYLDWNRGTEPPLQEAAGLIYEMGNTQHPNRGSMHHRLAQMLLEIPGEYRMEVVAKVPADLRETMLEEMPAQVQDTIKALAHRGEEPGTEHSLDHSPQWDLAHAREAIDFIRDVSGENAAHQLERVVLESRDLDVRRMQGYVPVYGNDTHERYVRCIAGIPEALQAREKFSQEEWGPEKLSEAAQHEVNRMAYRINLEIQDRLTSQLSHSTRKPLIATVQHMEDSTVATLREYGESWASYVNHCRHADLPTGELIEMQSMACIMDLGLEKALVEGNRENLPMMLRAIENRQAYEENEQSIRDYLGPDVTGPIDRAVEMAAQWPRETIQDGSREHHLEYRENTLVDNNGNREQWLEVTGQTETRNRLTQDCVIRALNDATGGGNYPRIWEEITQVIQEQEPHMDADEGAEPPQYRAAYERYGMTELLEANGDADNPLYKHLDVREIPTLIDRLSAAGDESLTCVACSERHAVMITQDEVRDTWDSRDIGDRTTNVQDGRLIELWINGSEEVVERAREILAQYQVVRQHDDLLTQGKRWRLA